MKRNAWVVLALGTAALAAAPAAAQVRGPDADDGRGLVVGANVNATRVTSAGHETGGGMGVTLGYALTPALSLFARGGTAYNSSQLDAGARYGFGSPSDRVRPYFEGALSRVGRVRAEERDAGYGVTGATGIEVRMAKGVAIDLGVSSTYGQFDGPFAPSAFTSTRALLGVRWRP